MERKKLTVLFCLIVMFSSGAFAMTWKPVIGYGMLQSPSLEAAPGDTITKNAVNFELQVLWDAGACLLGTEIGYLPLYEWTYTYYTYDAYTYTLTPHQGKDSWTAIPVLAEIQYPLANKKGSFVPYLTGAIGMFMVSGTGNGVYGSYSTSESDFGYAIGVSALLKVSESTKLDLNVKYYGISTKGNSASLLNIGIGMPFGGM